MECVDLNYPKKTNKDSLRTHRERKSAEEKEIAKAKDAERKRKARKKQKRKAKDAKQKQKDEKRSRKQVHNVER